MRVRQIDELSLSEFADLSHKGSSIWLIDISTIPYHLGFSVDGKYYSLKFHGKDEAIPVSSLLKRLNRTSKALAFIPLNVGVSQNYVDQVFGRYTSCVENDCSCIRPILELFGFEQQKEWTLKNLLESLDLAGQLSNVYGINLPKGVVELEEYDYAVVEANLNKPV